MSASLLPLHPELARASRLSRLQGSAEWATTGEMLVLSLMGCVAAVASSLLDLHLRVPGHAILRVVFPMAVGLAVVPRRGAGFVMGGTALLTALALRFSHVGSDAGMSIGALTSLTATGPLLDVALRQARNGRRLYLAMAVAGLGGNLIALVVRGAAKGLALDHGGGRSLLAWLPSAIVSYSLCGLAAGLVSGRLVSLGSAAGERGTSVILIGIDDTDMPTRARYEPVGAGDCRGAEARLEAGVDRAAPVA
ncbi:MAG: hypothetical protein R3B90_13340 [Planctomycetaceae bacterium]